MADVVEFTTSRKVQNLFYRISNEAVVFEVKGVANGAVCLAQEPRVESAVCWILFNNNAISFKFEGRYIVGIHTGIQHNELDHDLLSFNEYRKFWVTWIDGTLKMGQNNEVTPLVSLNIHDLKKIKFVTFAIGQNEILHWKCHLPPSSLSVKQPLKEVEGGKLKWVKIVNNKMPEDSVIGGYENEILYIARAYHESALTPGKYVPSSGKGFVSWGGWMHEKNDFEILCGFDYAWVQTKYDKIPLGAIEAGYVEVTHEIMYVGRVFYDGHHIPGKIAPSHKCCYFPYKGKEVAQRTYEILVNPNYINRAANDFYINKEHSLLISY